MNDRQLVNKVSFATKIKRALWNVTSTILFRPFVTKLFRPWRIALLRLFGAHIDWSAEVYASAKIWAPWNLKMESGTCIGPDVICYNQAMLTLHKNACISQYAYICTAGHATTSINNAETGLLIAPVTLEEGAWIGTRAYINMGVTIGSKAIVGACACVFKDVEPQSVVGGNPAVKLR